MHAGQFERTMRRTQTTNRARVADGGIGAEVGVPDVVDRAEFQADIDALRIREKAHTRAGDTIAAARRRLPMVELDATIRLVGTVRSPCWTCSRAVAS
jgi:Bacterial protein of unknown function (DUF899)